MRGLVGAVLAVGLLMGCGGIEDAAAPQEASGHGEVQAMACNDCGWLFVRCMSRAPTPEAQQACEESRQLCEFTFCECPGLGCPSAQPE